MSRRLSLIAIVLALACGAAGAAEDYSPAERLVFMSDHLGNVKPPATLGYTFRKSGALEDGFSDRVSIAVDRHADGSCCDSHGEFLSGARRIELPDVGQPHGNPVILFFLEHDVRDMQRLTHGQQAHFRRMIRTALYKEAQVRDTTLRYRDREVQGKEVSIEPYLNDAQRNRFEKFSRKRYVFLFSDAVPGGVYGIRSSMRAENVDAPPLIVEEMYIDGAQPPAPAGPHS